MIIELCKRGHADRVVLGHDTHVRSDSITREQRQADPSRATWHYTYLSEEVLPRLYDAGVPQKDIDQMLIDNPRRVFTQHEPY
ncbi:hypothetical protein GCM10025867_36800 [Frondihabitans sucicola]|uniref:Phosphotriesterase-related protein n=1 Tax=Frondihabitans sucicola TaxID=1268041 RepID=A0ABM8GSK3_9MICO|nr:hypothetical protein [Frondihabitans sucicola]BDZ51439.1 hypothetical protein GCM10025867_36800 [Frondihabitans sucicola]